MTSETLGPYRILDKLGEGGMGQVYRARDSKLDRDVAIKILPGAFADDPERLARFEREAKTLAALNHPNIAAIYGLEEGGGVSALVMELVDGEDLSQRIARGPMPLDEALPIAKQIAEALDAAHEQGIIHRDLKPGNIKVRADGTVKVLDFGLAKAMDDIGRGVPGSTGGPDKAGAAMSMSPTIMSPVMSGVGVILGTAAYMAPEQARGKRVDKRADIWAFGVVLLEMVTGRRAFPGDEVSDVLASVLARDPDLTAVPPRVRGLLTRCLAKDPRQRLRDIGDAMSLVDAANASDASGATVAPQSGVRRWSAIAGWAVAAVIALGSAIAPLWQPVGVADGERTAVKLQLERSVDVYNRTSSAFAVSPDGRTLAYYGAGADGPQTLLVRTLATGEVRAVPNSANSVPLRDSLFWSPDSKQLVRGAASGAEAFDVTTNTSRPLCNCRYLGGSWSGDGTILLGGFGDRPGISRLTLTDSTLVAITTADASRGEQDTFPVSLPDGRFLFTRVVRSGQTATFVGTLDRQPPTKIADGSFRVMVPGADGHSYLLGVDGSGIVSQPFDVASARVTGPTVVLASGVSVSASQNGVLATSAVGTRPRTVPTWFTRKGMAVDAIGEITAYEAVALSADGRKLLTAEPSGDARGGTTVWLRDLLTGARSRMTFDGGGTPVWSPDGSRLAFTASRGGVSLPFQRAANGTGGELPLFDYRQAAFTNDWSRDGRTVLFSTPSPGNIGNDLWVAAMNPIGAKPVPYIVAPGLQQQGQFSPDGRFVAYGSDQAGTFDIYVQPFPDAAGGKWQVSTGGGVEPRWSRDGKELFYWSGQTLMAVPITLQPTFSNGTPVKLFDAPVQPGYTSDSHRWQVAPDGSRFLILANAGDDRGAPLDVVVNWTALLKQ